LIDEIPILAILATQFKGEIVISNAEELRFKESDRIKAIYENLFQMGADIILTNKGFRIVGNKTLHNTSINHYGDHRIAMSFDILNLFRNKKFANYSKNLSKVSFPEFRQTMNKLIK
jgi:3-phosphoshikimate 1-carboxyvinyltransferase